ncbi:hypothetical protein [Lacinutrix algicola]|uniref:hypothetical protein n=1 Tax=Lacinutrix algicola TaxID=342954 RepID=UPI0006E2CD58|nr:hypothetical protein [Lacinutrix algicola]
MNKLKNTLVCFFVLCFLVIQESFSQTYAADNDTSNSETVTLNNTDVSEVVFNSFFNTTPNQNIPVQGSSVFLSQIGDDNLAKVRVSAQASDINIEQNGNDNDVNLTYKVKSVYADLQQNGDNNYILDYSINVNQDISLDLQQNGDNLNFERFGTNELSKNIKFKQTAASPTIIIRSFN